MRGRGSVEPGTIVAVDEHGIGVACGEGRLEITELQRAGGKRLGFEEFLRGFPLEPGVRFEAAA
jgi:methionyl-tRNA formyltransferase